MKKYLFSFLVLSVMCLGFGSCSEDDIDTKDIVGLWTFVNMTADITHPDKEKENIAKSGILLATLFMQGSTIDIKANGTLVFTFVGESQTGTYKKNGNKFNITSMGGGTVIEDVNEDVYITLEGNILTLTQNILDDELRTEGFTKYITKMNFKK